MQIIATGVVPDQAVDRAVRWDDHRRATGRCLLCDVLADETADGSRLVAGNDAGIVTAAIAGRYPFEMLLVPARHAPVLGGGAAADFAGLGRLLARALGALRRLKGDCSLNLVFHGAPRVDPGGGDPDPRLAALAHDPAAIFHWHLEIIPRLTRSAGFEIGTGFTINAVFPEEAARLLRAEGDEA
jgi:UDPglucose--hexose-1-phosphate uridylyltransferase